MIWLGIVIFFCGYLVGVGVSVAVMMRDLQEWAVKIWEKVGKDNDFCLGARGVIVAVLMHFGFVMTTGDEPMVKRDVS